MNVVYTPSCLLLSCATSSKVLLKVLTSKELPALTPTAGPERACNSSICLAVVSDFSLPLKLSYTYATCNLSELAAGLAF